MNTANQEPKASGGKSSGIWKEVYEYHLEKVRDLFPKKILKTGWLYVTDHQSLFDKVFSKEYTNITPPLSFFLVCMLFVLSGVYNHEKTNKTDAKDQVTMDMVVDSLDENEIAELLNTINFNVDSDTTDELIYEKMKLAVGETSDQNAVTVGKMIPFLNEQGNKSLSARVEVISNRITANKDDEDSSPPEWFLSILIILYFIPFWLLTHRFLKCRVRTPTETCYVYMYSFAMLYGIIGVGLWLEEIAGLVYKYLDIQLVNEFTMSTALALGGILLLILFVKQIVIFRYTHDVGFWRLMWAGIATNMVIMLALGSVFLLSIGLIAAFS